MSFNKAVKSIIDQVYQYISNNPKKVLSGVIIASAVGGFWVGKLFG